MAIPYIALAYHGCMLYIVIMNIICKSNFLLKDKGVRECIVRAYVAIILNREPSNEDGFSFDFNMMV